MANLAGKMTLRGSGVEKGPTVAVEEWSTRVGTQFPGEVDAPRNTLRGHPQPWRTRPVNALSDEGPLHYSVKPVEGGDYTLCRGGINTGSRQVGGPAPADRGASSSTASLAMGEWEGRLGKAQTACGMRGSIAPNWKPREQQDLTQTGSVNLAGWAPGTQPFVAPGTVTLADVMKGLDDKQGATWSTASLARNEWETRLDEQNVGTPL